MKVILCGNWGFGPCYVNDLAFGGVEFHVPVMTPALKVVKIFLQRSQILVIVEVLSKKIF